MSMNLNASTKKHVLELRQTPSQISWTILPPHIREARGKAAAEALLRYMEWVRHSLNGSWDDKEKLIAAEESVREHLDYVSQFLKDKTLRVWVM